MPHATCHARLMLSPADRFDSDCSAQVAHNLVKRGATVHTECGDVQRCVLTVSSDLDALSPSPMLGAPGA